MVKEGKEAKIWEVKRVEKVKTKVKEGKEG